jgi:hypothetical protein
MMATVTYPNPLLTYQGSGLQILPTTAAIGPFTRQTPGGVVGLDYFKELDKDNVPETRIRPYLANAQSDDPCTVQIVNYYKQNGVEWDMIFRITSDQSGGTVGTSAALQVLSNYPQISMSIPKFTVAEGGFGILKRAMLPSDYTAELTFSYWDNGKTPAVDGWLMLEVSYVKEPVSGELTEEMYNAIEKVSVARVSLLPCPTPVPMSATVLGASYR